MFSPLFLSHTHTLSLCLGVCGANRGAANLIYQTGPWFCKALLPRILFPSVSPPPPWHLAAGGMVWVEGQCNPSGERRGPVFQKSNEQAATPSPLADHHPPRSRLAMFFGAHRRRWVWVPCLALARATLGAGSVINPGFLLPGVHPRWSGLERLDGWNGWNGCPPMRRHSRGGNRGPPVLVPPS